MKRRKRKIVLLMSLIMVFSMIPQMAFAAENDTDAASTEASSPLIVNDMDAASRNSDNSDAISPQSDGASGDENSAETPSIAWSAASATGTAGVTGTLTVNAANLTLNADDFTVASSNNAVIPEEYTSVSVSGNTLSISYFPIQTGSSKLTVTSNSNELVKTDELTVAVGEKAVQKIVVGKSKVLLNKDSVPFAYTANITDSLPADTEVIRIENNETTVTAVNPGTAKVHFTSTENENVDFSWSYEVSEPTYTWQNASPTAYVGESSGSVLQLDAPGAMQPEEFTFQSDNEEIIPTQYITASQYVRYVKITYFPIKVGDCTITITSTKYPNKVIDKLKVSVKEIEERSLYEGSTLNLSYVFQAIPFECALTVEDTSIAEISEAGILSGKAAGSTRICATSKDDPELKFYYPVAVKPIPESGLLYNETVCRELNWNVQEQGDEISINWQRWTGTRLQSSSSHTSIIIDSSNTDVVEPNYTAGFTSHRVDRPLKLNVKKNGTAVVSLYVNESRDEECTIGTCKITVTGANSDSENGWIGCDEPQGLSGKIHLLDYPVETQSFNNGLIENNIAQYINANNVQFRLQLTGNVAAPAATAEEITTYEQNILSRINICAVNEDGSRGDVIASAGSGYEAKFTYDNSATACTTVTITVDKNVLKKGTSYMLTGEKDLIACAYYGAMYYTNQSFNQSKYHFPVGVNSQWTFKTMDCAQTIVMDQSSAEVKAGDTFTLTAKMNEDADDTIIWDSSDPAVASVDQNGMVTAKTTGRTVITATADDGKVSDKCIVIVPGILIKDAEVVLTEGETYQIDAELYSGQEGQKITWTSSNESAAAVDEDGSITAFEEGEATITGTAGDFTVTCKVIVKALPAEYGDNAAGDNESSDQDQADQENAVGEDSAKTGDDMMIWMFLVLMTAAGIAGAAVFRKKNCKSDQ